MSWVLIFWHKVWNCWPERYGKFQSEIPSTSGAICEKPQGGPFGPPPSGARVNMNIKPVYHHYMTFNSWRATFGDLLHGHSPETTLEIGKNMEKCPGCMVHTAVYPMKVASSHFLACIWGGAPSCWKLKLPSVFKAVPAFRTLKGQSQLVKGRPIYSNDCWKYSLCQLDHAQQQKSDTTLYFRHKFIF